MIVDRFKILLTRLSQTTEWSGVVSKPEGRIIKHATGYCMPMYDYKCLDCGKESLLVLTLKEHESSKVTCPKCGSTNMRQLYTSFVAHTTKKS